jgi:hypothetical protein
MNKDDASHMINSTIYAVLERGVDIHDVIEILQFKKVQLCDHANHIEANKAFQQHIEKEK